MWTSKNMQRTFHGRSLRIQEYSPDITAVGFDRAFQHGHDVTTDRASCTFDIFYEALRTNIRRSQGVSCAVWNLCSAGESANIFSLVRQKRSSRIPYILVIRISRIKYVSGNLYFYLDLSCLSTRTHMRAVSSISPSSKNSDSSGSEVTVFI